MIKTRVKYGCETGFCNYTARMEVSMPRPRKNRRVCCLPESNLFGPICKVSHRDKISILSVVEYETIRLIDYENMSQEACADSMDIARTTVQKIYSDARKILAKAIVEGNAIKIEGGNYKLFNGDERMQGHGRCRRHRQGQELEK